MAALRRYARLWRQFLVTAVVRETEYRFNFWVGVGEGLAQLGLAVLSFVLLYQYTDVVAGWTRDEALLLLGIYRIVEGVIAFQIAPNLYEVSGAIRSGDMDFLLLRPVSSQFLVSLRRFALPEVFNIAAGVALTIYAGNQAGVRWNMLGIAEAAAFIACGLLLLYAVWFAIVTCSFWLTEVSTIDTLFNSIFQTARYPVSFFKGLVRAVLTFAIPVAFATTFPAEALLGRADLRLLGVGFVLAVLALVASNRFWTYAVRHYSSASS